MTNNKQEAQGALRRSPGYVANQLKNYPDNLVEISNIGMLPAKFGWNPPNGSWEEKWKCEKGYLASLYPVREPQVDGNTFFAWSQIAFTI